MELLHERPAHHFFFARSNGDGLRPRFGKQLVGVTHECDFPSLARSKPIVVRNALALEKMTIEKLTLR